MSDPFDVLISPFDYLTVLREIEEQGRSHREDRSGNVCELILDTDGFVHRQDRPEVYVKLVVKNLEDLAASIELFSNTHDQ